MISHKNLMLSAMQGFISGVLNRAVAPVSSSAMPSSTDFVLIPSGVRAAPAVF